MKRMALLLLLVFSAAQSLAVDKSAVTIKQTSTYGDVIFVTVQESGKSIDLQCTKNAPNCLAPQAGTYWLVRLPKNHGYYDCDNVDIYAQSADPDAGDKPVGEYCVSQK